MQTDKLLTKPDDFAAIMADKQEVVVNEGEDLEFSIPFTAYPLPEVKFQDKEGKDLEEDNFDMSVEDAIKLVVSAGMVVPPRK